MFMNNRLKTFSAASVPMALSFFFATVAFAQQPPVVSDTSAATVPAAEAVAVPPADLIDSSNAKISLDFKDAEIGTVLRVISLKSGVNIVAGPEVIGVVTIRLEEVEWQKALDVILRTYNYVYEKDGNVIRVTTRDKMQMEPVDTKTFILNYSRAAEVQGAVQDILTERGRVKIAERMNMLIVTDIPSNLFQIGEVISRIDKPTPQAYIDSKIINTNAGVAEDLGISWTVESTLSGSSRPTTFPFVSNDGQGVASPFEQFFPTQGAALAANALNPKDFPVPAVSAPAGNTFTYGTMSFANLRSVLRMLQTDTRTKVISNPRIVVLNNQTAEIQVGSEIPLPTYERNENTGSMEVSGFGYRDIGVVLKVTPHINDANEIMVDLAPEVSTQGANVSFQADFQAPSFNVTQAKTQVMMKSGETIAIGGLLTDNEDVTETKVPYLGDIPVLGKLLFKSKRQNVGDSNEKAETLFFVTVTSVDTSGQPVHDSAKQDNSSSQDSASTADSKSSVPATSSASA